MFNNQYGIQSPRITNDNLMDSVSEIKFGSNDIFATSSWDGYIRFYQIIAQNKYRPEISLEFKTAFDCQEPVLSINWKRDMSVIFAALADNTIRAYDIKSGQNIVLGYHEECPARQIFWNDDLQVLASLGFDKKLKLWSLKQPPMGSKPNPVFEINLTSTPTVGDQDFQNKLIAYADVDYKVKILQWEKIRGNMNSVVSRTYFDSEDSKLGNKSQISTLSISSDIKQLGYCSVDGRGCVLELNDKFDTSSRIIYKCHKIEEEAKNGFKTEKINKYFVTNTLQFNPRSYDWVSTGGSDGQLIYWDLKKKNKISTTAFDGPVITSQVSPDGNFIVYAIGYDWGMGLDGLDSRIQNYVQAQYIDDKSLYYL